MNILLSITTLPLSPSTVGGWGRAYRARYLWDPFPAEIAIAKYSLTFPCWVFHHSSWKLTQGHYSVFQNVRILGDKVLKCKEFVTFVIHVMTTS